MKRFFVLENYDAMRTHSLCFAAILLLAPIQDAVAISREDVLFHVSFDAGVNPVFARGDRTVTTKGTPAFVEGKIGRALTCKGDAASIVLQEQGQFRHPGRLVGDVDQAGRLDVRQENAVVVQHDGCQGQRKLPVAV